jgi:transcriptional regulator with XRE-family HTH domain
MTPREPQTDFNELVGENLKRYRMFAGLSQAEIADKLGAPFDQSTIARAEKGERPLKLHEAIMITSVLGIDPAKLWAAFDQDAAQRLMLIRSREIMAQEMDDLAQKIREVDERLATMEGNDDGQR